MMMSLFWLGFALAALSGPDFFLIRSNTLLAGRAIGYVTLLGNHVSLCIHICIAVLGLALVLRHSQTLYFAVTPLGGCYLAFHGRNKLHNCFVGKFSGAADQSSVLGELILPYKDIEKVQGAVLKNPGWLAVLRTLAAIFGKGSQRLIASGQALMIGNARHPGIALTLKRGGVIYLLNGAPGETFEHMQKFLDGLQDAGIVPNKEPLEVRGLSTEPRFDRLREQKCSWMLRHPLWVMIIAPFLGVLVAVCIG